MEVRFNMVFLFMDLPKSYKYQGAKDLLKRGVEKEAKDDDARELVKNNSEEENTEQAVAESAFGSASLGESEENVEAPAVEVEVEEEEVEEVEEVVEEVEDENSWELDSNEIGWFDGE